jgi:hypothetical protein
MLPWLCILSLFVAWLLNPLFVRNLPVFLVLLAGMIGLASPVFRLARLAKVAYATIVLAILSAFSPIDLSVTSGDTASVRIVPIVYTFAKAGDLEAEGRALDRDFVHYRGFPMLNRAQIAVLLIVGNSVF